MRLRELIKQVEQLISSGNGSIPDYENAIPGIVDYATWTQLTNEGPALLSITGFGTYVEEDELRNNRWQINVVLSSDGISTTFGGIGDAQHGPCGSRPINIPGIIVPDQWYYKIEVTVNGPVETPTVWASEIPLI